MAQMLMPLFIARAAKPNQFKFIKTLTNCTKMATFTIKSIQITQSNKTRPQSKPMKNKD
jgi:hypothetical protein